MHLLKEQKVTSFALRALSNEFLGINTSKYNFKTIWHWQSVEHWASFRRKTFFRHMPEQKKTLSTDSPPGYCSYFLTQSCQKITANSPIELILSSCFRKASHLALKKPSQALFACTASSQPKAWGFFSNTQNTICWNSWFGAVLKWCILSYKQNCSWDGSCNGRHAKIHSWATMPLK